MVQLDRFMRSSLFSDDDNGDAHPLESWALLLIVEPTYTGSSILSEYEPIKILTLKGLFFHLLSLLSWISF